MTTAVYGSAPKQCLISGPDLWQDGLRTELRISPGSTLGILSHAHHAPATPELVQIEQPAGSRNLDSVLIHIAAAPSRIRGPAHQHE